jgi:tRNA (cmo5U34)-methyltransferase
LDQKARSEFFKEIAIRLLPDGCLASSTLSGDVDSPEYHQLFQMWFRMKSQSEISAKALQRMPAAYKNDLAVLPALQIENIIKSGRFNFCVKFYQAELIQAWVSRVIWRNIK